jgi:hypothetical protein
MRHAGVVNGQDAGMNLQSLLKLMGLRRNPEHLHEAQLRSMSSRELADLGIGSSQIPAVLQAGACDKHAGSSSRLSFSAFRAACR